MSDYISRQAAIEALNENRPDVWTDDDYELGMKNQHDSDIATIKALPSAHPDKSQCLGCNCPKMEQLPSADVPHWIPCSERLPDSEEDVLCDDDGRVTIGYYTDELIGWHDMHSYKIYPEAWMPLPEPYKEGNDEQIH